MDGAGKTWKELIAIGVLEAVGTMILLIAINFNGGNAIVTVTGILTGAVLSGRLTGAHFNLSVTLGVFLAEDTKKQKGNLKLLGVMIVA